MHIKKTIIAGLTISLLALTTACSSGKAAETDKPRIAFSFGQNEHPFFIAMKKGAEDAAKELGVDLSTSSADSKLETQVANIENNLQQHVDAILVNPIDSEALATTVVQATTAGVPVFTVDVNVVGADVSSFVASDNTQIGRMAATNIIEKLNGKGSVAVLGWPTITSTRDRQQGFMEELQKAPGIKVVATSGGATDRAAALDSAENILQSNPGLDAIFGVNESGALGALGAADAQGKTGVYIVGVDATPDLLEAIGKGTQVKAAIAQDPYQMGKTAVEQAVAQLAGKTVEKKVNVPIDLVTKENVQKFIDREAAYAK
ncbi:substrate-binding domain-containing protein [Arthrobacter sp. NPDC093128]|uniref:sugar ABC transporter substrate-binding protein n=1 Tax=Arthrobacter sp. NPDC093128 TaxID=3154979 RepID=UPI003432813C